jgi:hypothetical protein
MLARAVLAGLAVTTTTQRGSRRGYTRTTTTVATGHLAGLAATGTLRGRGSQLLRSLLRGTHHLSTSLHQHIIILRTTTAATAGSTATRRTTTTSSHHRGTSL